MASGNGAPNTAIEEVNTSRGLYGALAPSSRIAGDKAVKLIREEPNETIIRIVDGGARNFDTKRELSLGFVAEASMDQIIRAHIEDELGGKIGG